MRGLRGIVGAAFVIVLAGCDAEEFERQRARAYVNERIRMYCIPVAEQTVLVRWTDAGLTCTRYTTNLYRASVHVETQTVALPEEIIE